MTFRPGCPFSPEKDTILKRISTLLCAISCALFTPSLASAATGAGSVSGKITALGGSSLTIQRSGSNAGVINSMVSAANVVTRADYPYVWGGGHAQAGVASLGEKGPGFNGKRVGFDCSGAVAAVLAAGGLWPAGGGVPSDSGVISELRQAGLIVSGAGSGPSEVTLYDDPGVHIFMNIDGRFFGTSDGYGGNPSQKNGGAGWLDDGAPDATSKQYKRYHFVPSALKGSAGQIVTFQLGELASLASGFQLGESVKVNYLDDSSGSMIATAIAFSGQSTATGTVASIGTAGASFTITISGGTTMTFSTADAPSLAAELQAGDAVTVTYTKTGSTLFARSVSVTSQPTPPATSPQAGEASGGGGVTGYGYGYGGTGGGGY